MNGSGDGESKEYVLLGDTVQALKLFVILLGLLPLRRSTFSACQNCKLDSIPEGNTQKKRT